MNLLVLGAGLQGCACAYDLLQNSSNSQVTLADVRPITLPKFLAGDWKGRLRTIQLDVTDSAAVRAAFTGHAAVMSAIPYYYNGPMAKAAVECGSHFCDLGGNTDIVLEQKKLHEQALAKGISVIPDCGLAPGMVNILAAEGIRRLDRAEKVKIFVGGLPQAPEPPLNYQIVYSLEGALDYYTTPSWVLRGGKPVQVDALSEVEPVEFPSPVGTLEAFHTGGGISTLPFAYDGKIETMEYKTLRYPGHVAIMRPIRELGLLANEPIDVKGKKVAPRDMFIAAVHPRLHKPEGRDLVALQVQVTGQKVGKPARVTFRLLDYYDAQHGISAMMRTTGYSLSITGQMQVDGRVTAKGVHTPDEAMPFDAYVGELDKRGIRIEEL
ncbi:MAG TPA: saccharopine dehydrogenase C-terminal domain-containing protein [Gemmatimonadales bacterium]|nr:saccharopine dehydrogenase C-terminal domain-containing protein [Gemmatimonadales bacterium]